MTEDPDQHWMQRALVLAERAAAAGEVPVGALVAVDDQVLGEGWNRPAAAHDPTAHAEICALRAAAQALGNYRLSGATLYVTLEPCPMCAAAAIHARVDRVVFGAFDPKAGAAGSLFDLLPPDRRFNHRMQVRGGLEAAACARLLSGFFRARRGVRGASD